jgi:ABC-type polysaccharide/polyol phosphate transport system ATPase subunit
MKGVDSKREEDARPTAVRCNGLTKAYTTAQGTELTVSDVNLSIRQGEIVGIVGRNCCGKSTMLKMLAGVVKPTSGKAEVHGRVLAVLEVGTGFIPELSGEDNVRLTCRMAGMTEDEAEAQLPGIAAFSALEQGSICRFRNEQRVSGPVGYTYGTFAHGWFSLFIEQQRGAFSLNFGG